MMSGMMVSPDVVTSVNELGGPSTSTTGLNLDEILLDSWQPIGSPRTASSSSSSSSSGQVDLAAMQYLNHPASSLTESDSASSVFSSYPPSSGSSHDSTADSNPHSVETAAAFASPFDSILPSSHFSSSSSSSSSSAASLPSNDKDFFNVDMLPIVDGSMVINNDHNNFQSLDTNPTSINFNGMIIVFYFNLYKILNL